MVDRVITSDDVGRLATKLDGLTLDEDERVLLSALVNAGGDTLVESAPLLNKNELAETFKIQFKTSFTPGVPPGSGGVVLKIRG